ncbi:ADP-ribosylation factor H-like isoform X2 [Ruditapes philippinarum]|uniref:ADP-ribosylation factor H-like isoform X2 n=1 Tax=Ruditapes philippinarum TaxID=129788 RepID=UPI00295AD47E|nr:ADP-ribosylation factor H-like isoform X2 [Ruditapes philippinarum]
MTRVKQQLSMHVRTTIPTVGYMSETLNFKHLEISTWDIGDREKIRPLLRHYYASTHGIVFVLDSSDREGFDQTLKELFVVVKEEELRNIPVLVLANKQDISGAMKPESVVREIQNEQSMRDTRWMVFGVSAVDQTEHRLFEAFDWLTNEITVNERRSAASKMLHEDNRDCNNNNGDKRTKHNT